MTIQEALITGKPLKRPFMKEYLVEGLLHRSLVADLKKDKEYVCLVCAGDNNPIILLVEDVLALDWEVAGDN